MEESRKTIFVVDDNNSSLVKTRDLLSGMYNVFTLNSGEQLFKLLEKIRPDLILLDIVMPRLNGYEIIEILKGNPADEDIPVIFLTGFANEESEIEGLSKGAIDYIVKPYSAPLFLKRIELHLSLEEQKREIAAKAEKELVQMKERQREQQHIKTMEERIRAKTRFLASISHELCTPVSAVMGISEIQMQNKRLPADIAEAFDKIHDSASILHGMINNLIDLSSIDAGKMAILCSGYETAVLINDIANMAHLSKKDLDFNVLVDENIPSHLIGDTRHIKQIMSNLLSNAFKYTISGYVELSFSCRHDREKNVFLIITVKDTGMGMTPEHLETIHNEYKRLHGQGNLFVEGTGLGLLIVHSLAQLMDAHVEVESEAGKGTTVTVKIPQEVARPGFIGAETAKKIMKTEVAERAAAKKHDLTPVPMPQGSVLIVDDADFNLYVARRYVGLYGIKCETCISGYEAIEKIKQGNTYDIIFMDQMMPGMTGAEALQAIRALNYTKPIIAFTANTSMGFEEECLKTGFDDFLSKPIQADRLKTVLTKFIKVTPGEI